MTETKTIKQILAIDGSKAFKNVKSQSGAYVMRGNSIVHVTSDGSISVVKRTKQSRVKIKDSDRVVIIE